VRTEPKPGHTPAEFEDSMHRLDAAGTLVAVCDGLVRIIRTDGQAHQAVLDGFTLYTPADMSHYVQLEMHERRMLHEFKRRFGGIVEWRDAC